MLNGGRRGEKAVIVGKTDPGNKEEKALLHLSWGDACITGAGLSEYKGFGLVSSFALGSLSAQQSAGQTGIA